MVNRDTAWPEGTPCWADLAARDIPKAIAYYKAQFGWEIEPGGPEVGGYSLARVGGLAVAGIGPLASAGAPPAWTTYLAAEDAADAAARITKAGGSVLTGPMDVMDLGVMVVAADPAGGTFGVWQAGRHTGAQVANESATMVWNEQMSHDVEKAQAFYAAVFGYELQDMSSAGFSYATLNLGGRPVGGIGAYPPGVPEGLPGSWTTYFGVADTDASIAITMRIGGAVEHQPADTPFGRMAMAADDQGARYSMISVQATP